MDLYIRSETLKSMSWSLSVLFLGGPHKNASQEPNRIHQNPLSVSPHLLSVKRPAPVLRHSAALWWENAHPVNQSSYKQRGRVTESSDVEDGEQGETSAVDSGKPRESERTLPTTLKALRSCLRSVWHWFSSSCQSLLSPCGCLVYRASRGTFAIPWALFDSIHCETDKITSNAEILSRQQEKSASTC